MSKLPNIIGLTFNRLTVLEYVKKVGVKHQYRCLCSCGNECMAYSVYLKTGKKKSCGCLYLESRPFANRKHGFSKKCSEYSIWEKIKGRCNSQSNNAYGNYGGRGIFMCDRWLNSFEDFYLDMGKKPTKKHSIDRIDNDGPYSKENCRWATQTVQARNRRTNNIIDVNGIQKCVAEWAEIYNIPPHTVYRRIYSGWPKDERCLLKYSKNRYGLSDLLKDEKNKIVN